MPVLNRFPKFLIGFILIVGNMKLVVDYKVPTSKRAVWLLEWIMDVKYFFYEDYTFEGMIRALNKHSFYLRKCKYPCDIMPKKVIDNKLHVWTREMVLLVVIYFE